MGFAEKMREAFRLKEGDPEKVRQEEATRMMKAVWIILSEQCPGKKRLEIVPEELGAIIAAGYANLRRGDRDWRELDEETACRLYIGVAMTILGAVYDEDRQIASARIIQKHKKERENHEDHEDEE